MKDKPSCFREEYEKREYDMLPEYAAKGRKLKGRQRPIVPCSLRTDFSRPGPHHTLQVV